MRVDPSLKTERANAQVRGDRGRQGGGAINRDGGDVALGIEVTRAEHAIKLVVNIAFISFEAGRKDVLPANAVLLALRQARRDRHPLEMHQHRLVRRTDAGIAANIDHLVQRERGEI